MEDPTIVTGQSAPPAPAPEPVAPSAAAPASGPVTDDDAEWLARVAKMPPDELLAEMKRNRADLRKLERLAKKQGLTPEHERKIADEVAVLCVKFDAFVARYETETPAPPAPTPAEISDIVDDDDSWTVL